jgi:hypothetical protein
MPWINPRDVSSPRARWRLIGVLYDIGAGHASFAHGKWDGEEEIAVRWNGSDLPRKSLGNPQSSGYPTWFILPRYMVEPTLRLLETMEAPEDDPEKKRLAAAMANFGLDLADPTSAAE